MNLTQHRARHLIALAASLLATVASGALMLWCLATATVNDPAATEMQSYSTEYLNYSLFPLALLLLPVLGFAAALSVRVSLFGVAGVAVTQFWAVGEGNSRLVEAGWGQGLEVLAFAIPLGTTLLGLLAVVVGGILGRAR